MTEPEPIPQVLGRNCRNLRGELTLDDVAKACRDAGLSWGTSRISQLERGKVSPTIGTLILLAQAFGKLTGNPLRIADLIATDQPVALTKSRGLTGERLQQFTTGSPVAIRVKDEPKNAGVDTERLFRQSIQKSRAELASLPRRWLDVPLIAEDVVDSADVKAARSLGIKPFHVALGSHYLWGHSLSDERDRRAGPGVSAQKKGRVTRGLIEELRGELDRGDD